MNDVFEKHKLQGKIDDLLNNTNMNQRHLKTCIDALKKKKKQLGNKEELYSGLMSRYDIIRVIVIYLRISTMEQMYLKRL